VKQEYLAVKKKFMKNFNDIKELGWVTSVKQSPVLRGYFFLALSQKIST
jgi:hypothetical protein